MKTEDGVLVGELRAAVDDASGIAAADGERLVSLEEVAAAKTVVDWDEELRKGGDR